MDNNHKERKGIITVPLFSSCSLVLTTSAGLTAAADIEPATIPGQIEKFFHTLLGIGIQIGYIS